MTIAAEVPDKGVEYGASNDRKTPAWEQRPGTTAAGGAGTTGGGRGEAGSVKSIDVKLIRLPFLLPRWAVAQVLLPRRVFIRRGARISQRILAHELVHLEQLERMGLWRYWWCYLVLLLRCGYREHPMEFDAIVRAAEPRFLDAAGALLADDGRQSKFPAALPSRPLDLN